MKLNPALGLVIVLAIVAYPIFGNIGYYPIRLWDESRVAINAYEMYKSGNWIVTTYHWVPDMWNTKPPLLIWIQALSLGAFGLNDLSIRMISPLAALATCLFIYWLCARKYRQPWLGILTCLVLVTSKGYIRLHGARTGEYDALLVMFTTMYVLCYFLYLEESKLKYLYTTVAILVLATLTKGIAALLFLPALFVYTASQRKLSLVFRSMHFYIGIMAFLLLAGGYYLLREHYNPGYIAQVRFNEFGGRYMESDQEAKYTNDVMYYYRALRGANFIRWLVLMFAGALLGLTSKDALLRRLTLYSILSGFSYFIIVSFGSTKNEWYDLAAYPFFALVTAVGLFIICRLLLRLPTPRIYINYLLVIIFIGLVSWLPYTEIVRANARPEPQDWSRENDSISFYVRDILRKKKPVANTLIAYTGYQADLEWYLLLLREAGRPIDTVYYKILPAGKKVIAYQKEVKEYIAGHYNTSVTDTFNTLAVYLINGRKQ